MAAGKNFEQSEAWRLAVFFIAFIIISTLIEKVLHHVEHYFKARDMKGLYDATLKIKEELMLLGFISLLLVAVEDELLKICVTTDLSDGVACKDYSAAEEAYYNTPNTSSTHRYLGGASDVEEGCPAGESPFLEKAALHQVHILLFFIALSHISYSVLAMYIGQKRVESFCAWEFWGDEAGETVDALHLPPYNENPYHQTARAFKEQFTSTVDPLTYLILRHYFLLKNRLPHHFAFNVHLQHTLHNEYRLVCGISSWMWSVLVLQVILDGFGIGTLPVVLATVAFTLTVGTKLQVVSEQLVREILKTCKEDYRQGVTQGILDELQNEEDVDVDRANSIEPKFWFGKAKWLLGPIRLVMFQNSFILAELVFYLWQIPNGCYWTRRGWTLWVQVALCIAGLMHTALIVIPSFAVITTAGQHMDESDHFSKNFPHIEKLREMKAWIETTANEAAHVGIELASDLATQSVQIVHSASVHHANSWVAAEGKVAKREAFVTHHSSPASKKRTKFQRKMSRHQSFHEAFKENTTFQKFVRADVYANRLKALGIKNHKKAENTVKTAKVHPATADQPEAETKRDLSCSSPKAQGDKGSSVQAFKPRADSSE